MRVYNVCLCVCAIIAHVPLPGRSRSRKRLATADGRPELALSASRYSYKHNMSIFQSTKHFDLFIEYAGVPLAGTGRFYYVYMYVCLLGAQPSMRPH